MCKLEQLTCKCISNCLHSLGNFGQAALQILQALISLLLAHLGWDCSAWCPSVTPWPLLALLPCCPYTVGLLSLGWAWGQTFWEVKGQGTRWWCHCGCWRVAWRWWGWAVSRVSITQWVFCSLLTASGHPVGNRAPFDGFKQCLMTHTHLIRFTRLQKCGIRGQNWRDDEGRRGKTLRPLSLEKADKN